MKCDVWTGWHLQVSELQRKQIRKQWLDCSKQLHIYKCFVLQRHIPAPWLRDTDTYVTWSTDANIANMPNQNEQKKARLMLQIGRLKGRASITSIARAANCSRQSYYRAMESLDETGTLCDRPRSGRPVEYTPERMQKCVDLLVADESGMMGAKELHELCIAENHVKDGSYKQWMKHMKAHVKKQGHTLTTNSRGSVFYLAQSDVAPRLKFAKEHVETIEKDMKSWLIIDETTIERCPHPKGKYIMHAGLHHNS